MRKFIVHNDTIRIFNTEKELVKYLAVEKSKRIYIREKLVSKLEGIIIQTVEMDVLGESLASNYFEAYVENANKEIELKSGLGDETSRKLEKFKSMFLEFAKDDMNKKKFLAQLETTPAGKKYLSKLLSSWVGYLFSVSDQVEWFKSILDIHNFRKIEDYYVREVFYSDGTSRYSRIKVNDSNKENFEKAKALK